MDLRVLTKIKRSSILLSAYPSPAPKSGSTTSNINRDFDSSKNCGWAQICATWSIPHCYQNVVHHSCINCDICDRKLISKKLLSGSTIPAIHTIPAGCRAVDCRLNEISLTPQKYTQRAHCGRSTLFLNIVRRGEMGGLVENEK